MSRNTLRLLKLPEPVKAYINAGKITAGAARMLVGLTDPEQMAREIVERGLNVRQVEALAKERAKSAGKAGQEARAQECRYAGARAAAVECARPRPSPSTIAARAACCRFDYRSLDQLDEVLRRLEIDQERDVFPAHVA